VVGNPPYVRQEKLGREAKLKMSGVVADRAPTIRLSGRSDVHCYFWPAAAHFLGKDGYFGFLISSSWLDVEYGFALQRWILENFRIIAICESEAEPWFEDARVKTCVTILQRCTDRTARMNSLVRFVQFKRQLAEIIDEPADSAMRFNALDVLRGRIEDADHDTEENDLRIIVKRQIDLWREGVRAAELLVGASAQQQAEDEGEGQEKGFELSDTSTYAGGNPKPYFKPCRRL
jgi:hypothetical protein